MKKQFKMGIAALALGVMPLVTACPGARGGSLILWSSFGSSYTTALTTLVERYMEQHPEIQIDNQSQGSYKQIQTNIMNSISTSSYPNFANGYPDHFAGYIKSGIQLGLDEYIEQWDSEHQDWLAEKGYTSIVDDYYPEYMDENKNLLFHTDGTPYIVGLPFNKSTEVLGYNGFMFDYLKSVDSSVTKIPETWAEWATFGPKLRAIMFTGANALAGKYLYGRQTAQGDASDFTVVANKADAPTGEGIELLLDCSKVDAEHFRVLSWDALDNMFITLVRQWGGQYTSYTAEDMKSPQHGWFTAWDATNKDKTKAALQEIKTLHDAGIFGVPSEMTDDSYASSAFTNNMCFAMSCSSGGLSYNIKNGIRLRLSTVPYKDNDKKYVISQGTNLALFDQGDEDTKKLAFTSMVDFTRDDLQAQWAIETGYFPATKSAYSTTEYQNHLKATYDNTQPQLRAYQEVATLNAQIYTKEGTGWSKFVDPGFVGSSTIREEVEPIVAAVCAGEKTIDAVMAEVVGRLSKYIK